MKRYISLHFSLVNMHKSNPTHVVKFDIDFFRISVIISIKRYR